MILKLTTVAGIILVLTSCNYFTYTPRSKRSIYQAKPSIFVFSGIADFRAEQGRWPVSLEDMKTKGDKYAKAFEGFQYHYTHFRIIDSSRMVFSFSQHISDEKNYQLNDKTDLNSLRGKATFTQKNGKFIWKTRMQR